MGMKSELGYSKIITLEESDYLLETFTGINS
jgi:hypothetical protein